MAAKDPTQKGKMAFARQFLEQNHDANPIAVNAAWYAAGHGGSISKSAVGKMRAKLGLTDRSRSGRRPARAVATKPRAAADRDHGPRNGEGNRHVALPESDRDRTLEQLEAEIDRILFQVMALDGLSEVEEALRRGRRLLVLAARP